jgi:hypothetical protein
MSGLKHFATMTDVEVRKMVDACHAAAVDYATSIGLSGLSELGSHNVYNAIEDAIRDEWAVAGGIRITKGLPIGPR